MVNWLEFPKPIASSTQLFPSCSENSVQVVSKFEQLFPHHFPKAFLVNVLWVLWEPQTCQACLLRGRRPNNNKATGPSTPTSPGFPDMLGVSRTLVQLDNGCLPKVPQRKNAKKKNTWEETCRERMNNSMASSNQSARCYLWNFRKAVIWCNKVSYPGFQLPRLGPFWAARVSRIYIPFLKRRIQYWKEISAIQFHIHWKWTLAFSEAMWNTIWVGTICQRQVIPTARWHHWSTLMLWHDFYACWTLRCLPESAKHCRDPPQTF